MTQHRVTLEDFARLLGVQADALPSGCRTLIEEGNWGYDFLEGQELDDLVTSLLDRIRRKDFAVVVPGDKSRWVRGWGENLDQFVASKGDLDALAPKYVRPDTPVRLFRRYVRTADPVFEQNWRRVYQEWLFATYFADAPRLYEFGCGSGMHVAALAEKYPDKTIVGLDWAEPSVEIVENMRRFRGLRTEGRLFDFYNPDYSIDFPPGSVVYTFAALEQISDKYGAFVEFLMKKKPKLCVFIEPIVEWYDPANFIDHIARRSHETRNFLKGLPAGLKKLEDAGKIEVLKRHRVEFGSLLHEGYSQFVWRPL
jgi:hypothetical protein